MVSLRPRPATADEHQVDQLDADERHDQAAQAVDQQVVAQQRRGADGAVAHARSASGISATMISALKITADRIALRGRRQPHDVERVRAPGRSRRTPPG